MTYIIMDAGGTACGSFRLGREMIDQASMPIYHNGERLKGVDAIKFTVRDLDNEMTPEMAQREYYSPHAFGKTYMEHRKELELREVELKELSKWARLRGLDFILTVCSPSLVETYKDIVDNWKVASRDLDNIPLIEALAQTGKPIILSIGLSYPNSDVLRIAIDVIEKYQGINNAQITILYCVSQYPTPYENIDFGEMEELIDMNIHTEYKIGFSDHTTGILAPSIAVALGAKVIEKHITMDKQLKGTDNAGALDMEGVRRCVRDIRNTEKMLLPIDYEKISEVTEVARYKLGRSLAYNKDLEEGHVLTENDFTMVSPGNGSKWHDRKDYIGKEMYVAVLKNEHVNILHVK